MTEEPHVAQVIAQLREAAAKKCWPCACLHQSLAAIERAIPNAKRPADLDAALNAARERLTAVKYECLGCQVCFPAIALNALHEAGASAEPEASPTAQAEERHGWSPLPGDHVVRRYRAPVTVCTLTDRDLATSLVSSAFSTSSSWRLHAPPSPAHRTPPPSR